MPLSKRLSMLKRMLLPLAFPVLTLRFQPVEAFTFEAKNVATSLAFASVATMAVEASKTNAPSHSVSDTGRGIRLKSRAKPVVAERLMAKTAPIRSLLIFINMVLRFL